MSWVDALAFYAGLAAVVALALWLILIKLVGP